MFGIFTLYIFDKLFSKLKYAFHLTVAF